MCRSARRICRGCRSASGCASESENVSGNRSRDGRGTCRGENVSVRLWLRGRFASGGRAGLGCFVVGRGRVLAGKDLLGRDR